MVEERLLSIVWYDLCQPDGLFSSPFHNNFIVKCDWLWTILGWVTF